MEAALTPELCAGARAWLAQPVELVTKAREPTALFVPEGAWACVPRDSTKLESVGTDDATTCHCVLTTYVPGPPYCTLLAAGSCVPYAPESYL